MKTKIQINSIFGKLLFEFEKEDNSTRQTVLEAIKQKADLSSADLRYADLSSADLSSANLSYADLSSADLRSADLSSANLRSADLRSADLSSADLRYANLSYADLRSADLRSADLSSANLRSASTDKRYIQISCVGSAKRMTTYCFEDDKIWCGCFEGTLDKFEEQVRETHDTNPQYLKEYLLFIKYLKDLK
ncbi:MAG: pentapeptide repeat-containing protein [Nitrospiria bacterium]